MTVSHHYLRRRARAQARKQNVHAAKLRAGTQPWPYNYVVVRTERGPYRWRVERVDA